MNALPRLTIAQALTAFADERAAIDRAAATMRATTDSLVAREIANAERIERTYSVVRDGNDGYGIRCDQTHHFINKEPIATEAKANRLLEELEEGER